MLNGCSILTAKSVGGDAGSWGAIDRPSGVRFGAKSAISARRPSAGRYGGPVGFTTSSRSRLRRFSATPIQVRFSLTHHTAFTSSTREASMGKPIVVLFSVAALAGFAATNASATPIAPPVAPMSGVEQVRLICNEWGRCWRQPDYYRPYGYYRRYGDDDWRYRRYREGYGYYGRRYEGGDGGGRRRWGRGHDWTTAADKRT